METAESPSNAAPSFSYTGARDLQWPHLGSEDEDAKRWGRGNLTIRHIYTVHTPCIHAFTHGRNAGSTLPVTHQGAYSSSSFALEASPRMASTLESSRSITAETGFFTFLLDPSLPFTKVISSSSARPPL